MDQCNRPDVIADLKRRAAIIADAMQTAFGGRSQFAMSDLGCAIAGQMNNNGLSVHGSVYDICVVVYDATLFKGWEDEPDYNGCLPELVGACIDRLEGLGVDWRQLPHKLAHPERLIGQ